MSAVGIGRESRAVELSANDLEPIEAHATFERDVDREDRIRTEVDPKRVIRAGSDHPDFGRLLQAALIESEPLSVSKRLNDSVIGIVPEREIVAVRAAHVDHERHQVG